MPDREVRIRCGGLSDAERAVSQLQSSAIIGLQTAGPRQKTSCPQQPYPPSTLSGVLQPFQALAEEPLQRSDIPPEPSGLLMAFYGAPVICATAGDQRLNTLPGRICCRARGYQERAIFIALRTAVSDRETNVESEAVSLRARGLNPDVLQRTDGTL